MNDLIYVWAWAAIGFAWVWVAIGQGILAQKSMDVMGKNPKMTTFFLTITILWVALVETAAIYGFVIANMILAKEGLSWIAGLWAGLSIGLAGLWAWVWEWFLVWWALEAINRNPENKGKIMAFMILFLALIEVIAIYGFIIAMSVLGKWVPIVPGV